MPSPPGEPSDPLGLAEHRAGLLRYALVLTGEYAAAEDLVQDTFERAVRAADTFAGSASVQTWLHRIMHHRFVDLQRRPRPEPVEDDLLVTAAERAWRDDAYTVDPERVVGRALVRDDLLDALAHLPHILRAAVVLHDLEGLTSAQIADIHDIGIPAAKQRLRRGRALLVSHLADDAEHARALKGVPMRCWKARSLIEEYLDGDLTADQRGALEGHLTACPTCPGLYAAVVGVRGAVGALRDPESVVPPHLRARLTDEGSTGRSGAR